MKLRELVAYIPEMPLLSVKEHRCMNLQLKVISNSQDIDSTQVPNDAQVD